VCICNSASPGETHDIMDCCIHKTNVLVLNMQISASPCETHDRLNTKIVVFTRQAYACDQHASLGCRGDAPMHSPNISRRQHALDCDSSQLQRQHVLHMRHVLTMERAAQRCYLSSSSAWKPQSTADVHTRCEHCYCTRWVGADFANFVCIHCR